MILMVGDGATEVLATSQNFLLPNATFFFQLILFAIVFIVLSRYIIPPIRAAMAEREERVRRAQEEKRKADEQFEQAREHHRQTLSEARGTASGIRDEARASAREEARELREQAEREVADVRERGEQELAEQRERVRSDMEDQLPELSGSLAERILGRSLSDDDGRRSTIDGYLRDMRGESSESTTETAGATTGAGTEES